MTNHWLAINSVALFFMLANFLGNFLVIVVLLKVKTFRGVTSSMLLSLAFGDIFLGIAICGNVIGSMRHRLNPSDEWARKLKFYGNATLCAFTLIGIAVERYLAVLKPFYHKVHVTKKWACKILVAIWIVSALLSIPGYFLFPPKRQDINRVYFNSSRGNTSENVDPLTELRLIYEITVVCMFTVLPAILMSVLYGRIIYRVWLKPDQQGTNVAIVKARRKMTKLLLTITIAFYLCWWPVLLLTLDQISEEVKNWLIVFPLMSTALNPVIYSLHSASFRKGVRSLCSCACCISNNVCVDTALHRPIAPRGSCTATFYTQHNLNEHQQITIRLESKDTTSHETRDT